MNIVYWVGVGLGCAMFAASWLIRKREISEGFLARAELPLMVAGAGLLLLCGLVGFALW